MAGVWGSWNGQDETTTYGFESVKAFWYTGPKQTIGEQPRTRQQGELVMLHFHGGGYVCGTAAETDLTSSIAKDALARTRVSHVLSVDYRLAAMAPWPLPLLDAISAYRWLVKSEGISEADIIICGDSAGGHLALALTRWLRDEQDHIDLKMPKGLVLLSPWVDLGFSDAAKHGNPDTFVQTDLVHWSFGPFASSLLLRAQPSSIMFNSSYISPGSLMLPTVAQGKDSFERFPPTIVIHGEAECLAGSINTMWQRLRAARVTEQSLRDRLVCMPDATHDFMIFPWMRKEADQAYDELALWLSRLCESETQSIKPNVLSFERPRIRHRRSRPMMRWQRHPVAIAPPVASFRIAHAQLQY